MNERKLLQFALPLVKHTSSQLRIILQENTKLLGLQTDEAY